MNFQTKKAKVVLIGGALILLAVLTQVAFTVTRFSAEDSLSECAYEAEKLLVHIAAEETAEKVIKRSNLVYACMEASVFNSIMTPIRDWAGPISK